MLGALVHIFADPTTPAAAATKCPAGSHSFLDFLGFPTWYEYLPMQPDSNGLCTPQLSGLNDIWLVIAAVIEILTRVAALVAVGFVVYGGILYTTSEGDPQKTTEARHTLINALIGLVITVLAATIVNFVARQIQ